MYQPPQVTVAATVASISPTTFTAASHPRYSKYLKLRFLGQSEAQLRARMESEGLDVTAVFPKPASESVSWPPVFARQAPCVQGLGMADDITRGLVVVSGSCESELYKFKLFVYSLSNGSLVRSFGGKGTGTAEFNWQFGGLCMTPRGTVLVAEAMNDRLQEVNINDVTGLGGEHVRFVGQGLLRIPNFVDCSASIIAVSETGLDRVSLLSWTDGSLLSRFGSKGSVDGLMSWPCGLRLLSDGSGVVVADRSNNRLSIFSLSGDFVKSIATSSPWDVIECDCGASFIVTNDTVGTVSKLSAVTGAALPYGRMGSGHGEFNDPAVVAVVPRFESKGVELVVMEAGNTRFQVFRF